MDIKKVKDSIYDIMDMEEYDVFYMFTGKHTYGSLLDDGDIIINPYLFLVETYIHELIHKHDLRMSEHNVEPAEHLIMLQLNKSEIKRIYKNLMSRVEEKEWEI